MPNLRRIRGPASIYINFFSYILTLPHKCHTTPQNSVIPFVRTFVRLPSLAAYIPHKAFLTFPIGWHGGRKEGKSLSFIKGIIQHEQTTPTYLNQLR